MWFWHWTNLLITVSLYRLLFTSMLNESTFEQFHSSRQKVISSDGEELLNDIADQIVEEADSLGHDTLMYVTKAVGALAIRDEKSAAKALQSLMGLLGGNKPEGDSTGDASSSDIESGISNVLKSIRSNIVETLPEPVRTRT